MLVPPTKNTTRPVRIKVRISTHSILCLTNIPIGIFYEPATNPSVNKISFEDPHKLSSSLIRCLLEVTYTCIVLWYNVINTAGNHA